MQKNWKILSLALASIVLASGVRAMADDEDKLAKAPAVVQDVVKKVLGDKGKLEGFETTEENGKPAFDIDLSIGGTSYAMIITAAGEVIQREVEITTAMVPPAVLDAAAKAHADGKASEISIITHGSDMYYEVEMKVGKDEHDINITPDGKVLADTIAKPEAPDAGEKPEKDEKKD
jgi:uncharacterized membrane protein YkoI